MESLMGENRKGNQELPNNFFQPTVKARRLKNTLGLKKTTEKN